MQTGPITKRGKAKSSKNAVKHGLTSVNFNTDEEKVLFSQVAGELTDEYKPKTFTEIRLVHRVATHYVRFVRATNTEAAMIERDKITYANNLPIQETFGLTDEQKMAFYLALSQGQLNTSTDRYEEKRLVCEKIFQEIIGHIAQGGPHNTEPFNSLDTCLSIIFYCTSHKEGCSIEELFDGRFAPEQLIQSILSLGERLPSDYDANPSHKGRRIKLNLIFQDLQREFGNLITARNIQPQVTQLEKHADKLALAHSTELEKINRYITSTDRQYAKALGELRVVIEAREKREALTLRS